MPKNSWTSAQAPGLAEDDQQLPLPSDVPRPKDENRPANSVYRQSNISGSNSGNGGSGNMIGNSFSFYLTGPGAVISGVGNQGGQPGPGGAGIMNPLPEIFLAN